MKRGLQLLAVVLIVIAAYFVVSPYFALHGLQSALESGDSAALEDRVDFPRVREDLKAQLNAVMLKKATTPEMAANPFSALALGLASRLVEGMVDSFVTPAGIANLAGANNGGPASSRRTPSRSSRDPFANARVTRDALDRFSAWVPRDNGEEVRFVFHRYGVIWKLTGITIPPEALNAVSE